MRPLLSFVAIFKDEAACVQRTLDSVRAHVDRWTVLDTGSTDGTQQVVRDALWGVPGALHEEPFVDFATSRNRSLDLDAMKAVDGASPVFALVMSSDEVLEGGEALRDFLSSRRDAEDGAYCVEVRVVQPDGQRSFPSPRVLRTDSRWRYVGDTHEMPEGPNHERGGFVVPGVCIIHRESDPARKLRRMREYDLPRLSKRVADESHSLEERAAAIWFLAQTHEALAEEHPPRVLGGPWLAHKLQAMLLYRERALVGDDPILASYAFLCSLKIADRIENLYTHEEMLLRLNIVAQMNPKLPEARYMIALHAAQVDARQGLYLAETAARVAREARSAEAASDPMLSLPIDSHVEWASLGIAAWCAKALGNKQLARVLAERGVAAGGPRDKFAEHLGEEAA